MAGPMDFFSPGEWQDPLADPNARAALLQTGIALMQPSPWGQTGLGAVGNAIGQGAQAHQRGVEEDRKVEEQTRKQQETDSKEELRTAQSGRMAAEAEKAGMWAGVQQDKLGLARDRLGLDQSRYEAAAKLASDKHEWRMADAQAKLSLATTAEERKAAELEVKRIATEAKTEQEKLRTDFIGRRVDNQGMIEQNKNQRLDLSTKVRVSNGYQAYKKGVEEAQKAWDKDIINSPAKKGPRPTPAQNMQTWINSHPLYGPLYGGTPDDPSTGGEAVEPPTTAPGGAPAPATPAPSGANAGALRAAREAIDKGANRDAVIQRLKKNGIDPTGL